MTLNEPNTPADITPQIRAAIPAEGALNYLTAVTARGATLADGKPFETGIFLELAYWTPAGRVVRSAVVLSTDQAAALVAEVEEAAKVALYLAESG
jgi:hypothetical protein